MSKIYGKFVKKEVNENTDAESVSVPNVSIRYLASSQSFVFNVGLSYDIRIAEEDMLRLFTFDNLSELEQNEIYYHKDFAEEQGDLDDETYSTISLIQYEYVLSKHVLTLVKRKAHLRRLHKVDTAWYELSRRVMHSKGGRKKGSKKAVNQYNVDNYDKIAENCVARDWFEEFRLLNMECGEKNRTKIVWKWRKMRYEWKLKNGLISRNADYERELSLH